VAAAAGAGGEGEVRAQQQAAVQGVVQQQEGRQDVERSRQSFCHLTKKRLGMPPASRSGKPA
jgi:hypothetical protein